MTDLAGAHNYTYDNIYQLTQATHPNMSTEQFSYDAVGNRQTSEGQAPGQGRSTEYVYDFENRLIEIDYFGMAAQYKYDPFGRRIEKNVNGTIIRYLYDGPNIATEYDGSWNVTNKYVSTLDIDDPLTVTQGENTFYYQKDGLGSVVGLTDASGSVIKSYTYKSFGEIYAEAGSLVQPFTFTGREYDPESGLYYYRARYYDPRAGRFLTKDPIGFDGGDANLYRYTLNNAINFVDPLGLWCTYYQSTGQMICVNDQTGQQYYNEIGYAGTGRGWNNPDMQGVPFIGPIPRGKWKVEGNPYKSPITGRNTIRLTPLQDNECQNMERDCKSFRIHGNNKRNDASLGCIIMPENRIQIPRGEIIDVVR
jgi:RHS repeat-associated protein